MSVTSVSVLPSKTEYSVQCKYQGTNKLKTYILAPKFISSEPMKLLSHVWLFAIPWTVAYQAPPSMEFSRQEYWDGLPFPSSGDLPDPRIEPRSPALQADTLLSELPGKLKFISDNAKFWR